MRISGIVLVPIRSVKIANERWIGRITDINDIIAQVETIEQINEENKQAIAEAMVTLTDLHDQLAAILVQIQEAATVEQLQAINVKVQTISEGISMLVFVAHYDYDGVINGLDQCPDTPITEISEVNGVGCSPSQLGG